MNRRNVLVTGASGGIGAGIARAFAKNGDRVAVHYSASKTTASEVLASLTGEGHILVHADLRDAASIQAMFEEVGAAFGHLDVLVNNSGIFIDHPIETVSYEQWQDAWNQVLAVNLIGAANASWCAIRLMPQNGSSRIVNVGSRGAFRGEPTSPAYGASKAALAAFGQSIAKALAPMRISVTTLAPGFVATERVADRLAGESGDQIRSQSPFDRVATIEEVAQAILFLASPSSEWASGTVLDFNGASYLRM